jgi:hypothetical protein
MFGQRLRGQWLVPLCGVGRDGTASVYLMTAILLCAVPLMMVGAIAYYLFRQTEYERNAGPRGEWITVGPADEV